MAGRCSEVSRMFVELGKVRHVRMIEKEGELLLGGRESVASHHEKESS